MRRAACRSTCRRVIGAAIARVPGATRVSVALPPETPKVTADPTLLEQVLVNVLDNAVKYAPAGAPIAVSADLSAGSVAVHVADQGIGISEEDLPHVFDSFFRARLGDRTAPGTGLGLAIARGLLEAMGRRDRRRQPASRWRGGLAWHRRHPAPAGRVVTVLGRVLVIDDEPQIHRFLKPALEASGYAVERADRADEGLRLAAARAPDLVLLDLGLPDMDGIALLERLRAFSQVPVIVISARDREAEKIAALDGGADDYVEKPFAVGELMARIRAALRHRLAQHGIAEKFSAGDVEVDLMRRSVRVKGEAVTLSAREYALLALLVENAGRVMTHRQLLTAVWGPAHVHDVAYLRVYVGHLRQKLGEGGHALIATEPGVGYRLIEPQGG